ncbi:glycosyltransferase family 4 protein [Methylophilus methylotrophus]|uniref:glycosyltransferase family 4 protein n=1 Tax=Methylophilus methylotrophus TaxID=17 RepID=UPI002480D748|nr:glycosyltransferase family 4 protein [Methylophilus methylotrophus]
MSRQKALVFGIGSIAGVDSQKFKPDRIARQQVRSALNFTEETFLFLFLGRLNHDKGILELAQAYIRANLPNSGLLFVGPDEQDMQKKISQLPDFLRSNIRFIDYTNTPEQFMAAADVLCLPSYREGFGTVIIEAASCGIPAIASRIYGITDAVAENQTGLLHVAGDVDDICLKMQQIYADKPLYQSLATAAQQRAIQHFDSQVITQAWCDFYGKVLA